MKKYVLFLSLMSLGLWSALSAQQPTAFKIATGNWQGEEIEYVAGQVLVGLAQGADAVQAAKVFTDLNLTVLEPFDKLNIALLKVPEYADAIDVATTLSQAPRFRYAEPNGIDRMCQVHPDDPYYEGTSPATYPHQYALHNTGQNPPSGTSDADIDAPEAWEYETGSSSILIGVLDSGIPLENGVLSHPDLNDANRYILGQDFIDNPPDGVKDERGHGTHVTGIIAAKTNNDVGIAGVNWQCKILVEQVFDAGGSGSHSAYKNAVIHAVDNGAKVINYCGGGFPSSTKEEAVAYADSVGVVQVYSAGNVGSSGVIYPARYAYTGTFIEHANGYSSVISVAATQYDDERASYSSYSPGYNYVTVAAPGGAHDGGYPVDAGGIFSTMPNYAVTLNRAPYYVSQDYGYCSGTSMAAPHVAGLAGLILARFPSHTPLEVRTLIEQSAEDVNADTYPGFDERLGHGRINAHFALAPPTAPQNFQVTTYTGIYPYRPKLTWTANTEPDLAGYRIERKVNDDSWSPPNFGGDHVSPEVTEFIDMEVLIWKSSNNQTVYYRMQAFDTEGLYSAYTPVKSINFHIMLKPGTISPAPDDMTYAIPSEFELLQNYPNPFNSETSIKFGLPEDSKVFLKIFDIKGRLVRELCEKEFEAGYHQILWDGANDQGDFMPSGVYFYKINSDSYYEIRKMILIR